MIKYSTDNWMTLWVEINKMFCYDTQNIVDQKHGSRAFSINNEFKISSNDLNGMSHRDVGYTNYKLQLFRHNYVKPDELVKVKQIITDRHVTGRKSYTVISYGFEQGNSQHSMGSCVINILIFVHKIKNKYCIEFECNMRVAEITKRLLVDFIFFNEIIQEILDLFDNPQHHITFRSKALFAEPLTSLVAQTVIPGIVWDGDHWYHEIVRKQKEKLMQEHYRYKRGKRIRKYLISKEPNNV